MTTERQLRCEKKESYPKERKNENFHWKRGIILYSGKRLCIKTDMKPRFEVESPCSVEDDVKNYFAAEIWKKEITTYMICSKERKKDVS